jgi:hypothetical protein
MKLIYIILAGFISTENFGQSGEIKNKLSVQFGYGTAGSFFVRSYEENQLPTIKSFYKKKFIGTNINFGVKYIVAKKSDLSLNFTRQAFARKIFYSNNSDIYVDAIIRHFNNIFEFLYSRKLMDKTKSVFYTGIGVYYFTMQQEEVDVGPGGIIWEERNFKNSMLEEGGILIEASYEYKFQPKVNIGIKTQFYYTISTGEPESITLCPYVRIFFGK